MKWSELSGKWWQFWIQKPIEEAVEGEWARVYRDSPTETPFHKLVGQYDTQEPFGYPELFGADQEGYRQHYLNGAITMDQYKAVSRLFVFARNQTRSPSQITAEYLDIMGQTDVS